MGIVDDLNEIAGVTSRLTEIERNRKDKNRVLNGAEERKCGRCKAFKTLDQYYLHKTSANLFTSKEPVRYQSNCKDCCKYLSKRQQKIKRFLASKKRQIQQDEEE